MYFVPAESFRLSLAALTDVYSVLSRLSKSVQDVQKLPWERHESLDSAASTMGAMVRGLAEKAVQPAPARRTLQLDSAEIQRQLESTEKELAELWPRLDKLLQCTHRFRNRFVHTG